MRKRVVKVKYVAILCTVDITMWTYIECHDTYTESCWIVKAVLKAKTSISSQINASIDPPCKHYRLCSKVDFWQDKFGWIIVKCWYVVTSNTLKWCFIATKTILAVFTTNKTCSAILFMSATRWWEVTVTNINQFHSSKMSCTFLFSLFI